MERSQATRFRGTQYNGADEAAYSKSPARHQSEAGSHKSWHLHQCSHGCMLLLRPVRAELRLKDQCCSDQACTQHISQWFVVSAQTLGPGTAIHAQICSLDMHS